MDLSLFYFIPEKSYNFQLAENSFIWVSCKKIILKPDNVFVISVGVPLDDVTDLKKKCGDFVFGSWISVHQLVTIEHVMLW